MTGAKHRCSTPMIGRTGVHRPQSGRIVSRPILYDPSTAGEGRRAIPDGRPSSGRVCLMVAPPHYNLWRPFRRQDISSWVRWSSNIHDPDPLHRCCSPI